jgi:peroxiredoxin Q/BCP
MRPRPGEPAPDFHGTTSDGAEISLADYRGRTLVLYFYPKDFTPGCTAQACALRDSDATIRAKGAAILGVSTQDADSHRRFVARHNLPFPLLADPDGRIARAYGVMGGGGPLSFLTALAGLADRVTFVIGPDGRVAHVIDRPRVGAHGQQVLDLL